MRPRRRYIAFEVTGAKVSKGDIIKAINHLFSKTYGSAPGQALLKLISYEPNSRRGLLRCGHKHVDELKKAMMNVKKIHEKRASFTILGVSGTIKKARRKFLTAQAKG
jgi:ribonuclease P/MRP protein subunit POP5